MKIYTRTGDGGQTGLIGGARVPKDSLQISAIGDVDELNAAIGLAACLVEDASFREELTQIQCRLFDLGAELAGGGGRLAQNDIDLLETSIDRQTLDLTPLRAFVLPGGTHSATALHVARTVCRRAERSVLALSQTSTVALAYLNRLSDWLFTAARTCNARGRVPDVEWHAAEADKC